jgi:hypothetical protein
MNTDIDGIAESYHFPCYYDTRATHVHMTVQANITSFSSYSQALVQQLVFKETFLNDTYATSPYNTHLATLNRTTNAEESIYSVANADEFFSVMLVSYFGSALTG